MQTQERLHLMMYCQLRKTMVEKHKQPSKYCNSYTHLYCKYIWKGKHVWYACMCALGRIKADITAFFPIVPYLAYTRWPCLPNWFLEPYYTPPSRLLFFSRKWWWHITTIASRIYCSPCLRYTTWHNFNTLMPQKMKRDSVA